jgi:hypothetical protein
MVNRSSNSPGATGMVDDAQVSRDTRGVGLEPGRRGQVSEGFLQTIQLLQQIAHLLVSVGVVRLALEEFFIDRESLLPPSCPPQGACQGQEQARMSRAQGQSLPIRSDCFLPALLAGVGDSEIGPGVQVVGITDQGILQTQQPCLFLAGLQGQPTQLTPGFRIARVGGEDLPVELFRLMKAPGLLVGSGQMQLSLLGLADREPYSQTLSWHLPDQAVSLGFPARPSAIAG